MANLVVTICQESGEVELSGSNKIEERLDSFFEELEEDYEIEREGFDSMVSNILPIFLDDFEFEVKSTEDKDGDEFLEITYNVDKKELLNALEEVFQQIEESFEDDEEDDD